MFIDRILSPIETLGPGKRLVIWTRGCGKHCKGCANPELWETIESKNYDVKKVIDIIKQVYKDTQFDGITISGGDPLEQKDEMLFLLEQLNEITDDIIVYTGYEFHELENLWSENDLKRLKNSIAILIDGPYVEEKNVPEAVMRGSSNQEILFFKDKYKNKMDEYMKKGRKIQNVFMGSKMISVGIHDRRGDL